MSWYDDILDTLSFAQKGGQVATATYKESIASNPLNALNPLTSLRAGMLGFQTFHNERQEEIMRELEQQAKVTEYEASKLRAQTDYNRSQAEVEKAKVSRIIAEAQTGGGTFDKILAIAVPVILVGGGIFIIVQGFKK